MSASWGRGGIREKAGIVAVYSGGERRKRCWKCTEAGEGRLHGRLREGRRAGYEGDGASILLGRYAAVGLGRAASCTASGLCAEPAPVYF